MDTQDSPCPHGGAHRWRTVKKRVQYRCRKCGLISHVEIMHDKIDDGHGENDKETVIFGSNFFSLRLEKLNPDRADLMADVATYTGQKKYLVGVSKKSGLTVQRIPNPDSQRAPPQDK